jgi:hypothetical protein
LKIGWDVARAFLTEAASTVLSPDLEYSESIGNHNIGDPFHHFGIFFVFNSFDYTISLNDRQGLAPKCTVD